MITDKRIDDCVRQLYTWLDKRIRRAEANKDNPEFRPLDNDLINEAIQVIQELKRERVTDRKRL